ncbi:MAG: sulfur carrier protein ThiS [Gordonia sp. (in: high G+C Gram-positive bacteria)]
MNITINGEVAAFPGDPSVADVVGHLGLSDGGIAVAVDGAVVPRGCWSTRLIDGAVVEVVTAVQGG